MTGITYRPAALDDAAEILRVLIEIAPEIPVQTEPLESWVAFDEGNRIVGFLLAEPDQVRRHYAEHEILELRYGGVVKHHRRRGIFTKLIECVLARMVPVTATISPANQSGAARLLEKLSFDALASAGGEQRFRWDPGAAPKDYEQ